MRAIVEASTDAVYVRDLEGRFILSNPRGATLLGSSPEELEGRQDWEVFPPEVAHMLREADGEVLATSGVVELRISVPVNAGGPAHLEVRLVPWHSEAGAAAGIIMIARDVTAARQAEDSLIQRERQLADAQRLAQLASWEWDLERDEVSWAAPMSEAFGIEAPIGTRTLEDWLANVHPADRDRTRDVLSHAAQSGAAVELEHRIVRPDGSEGVLLCRAVVTRDENCRPVRMFGTSQDITQHRQAERSLREAMAAAERASEAKSEFLSRMSHELRTPLNAILGFGQVMAANADVSDRESVQEILSAGTHLLGMINDILDLSRIEAGRIALSLEPVALAPVVVESCDMIRRAAEQAGVTLQVGPCCERQHYLTADARRLKQVLLNLLTNGIKYNRRGGSVEVACSPRPEGRLRVEIHDTGIGMDAEQLGKLFSPFERGGAERSGIEGTGLGLALSKRLVEAMGGQLGVSSSPGRGSTFWFELAVTESVPGEQESPSNDVPALGAVSQRSRTVLYVEDSPANLRLIQRLFSRRPEWKLITATSGEQGVSLARRERPDLILLDVQLPDLNGDEVLWRIQQDPGLRHIPVVAVSGDATPRSVQRLLDLGAREYLTKPLDLAELLVVVEELLPSDEPLVPQVRPSG